MFFLRFSCVVGLFIACSNLCQPSKSSSLPQHTVAKLLPHNGVSYNWRRPIELVRIWWVNSSTFHCFSWPTISNRISAILLKATKVQWLEAALVSCPGRNFFYRVVSHCSEWMTYAMLPGGGHLISCLRQENVLAHPCQWCKRMKEALDQRRGVFWRVDYVEPPVGCNSRRWCHCCRYSLPAQIVIHGNILKCGYLQARMDKRGHIPNPWFSPLRLVQQDLRIDTGNCSPRSFHHGSGTFMTPVTHFQNLWVPTGSIDSSLFLSNLDILAKQSKTAKQTA